ncbi:MAG: right-handed parallel beta-helix repeat-containing protein [Candidatus Limnocylindrales bacterium]
MFGAIAALVVTQSQFAASPAPAGALVRAAVSPEIRAVCGNLQARIDATDSGGTLDLAGCSYTGSATITKSITVRGGTIAPPPGRPAIVVKASNVTLDGLRIIGSNTGVFSQDEYGVYAIGTVAAPVRGLTVQSSDIGGFGNAGIYASHVVDLLVARNTIHDVVYAGLLVMSGANGRVEGNTIQRVGVTGSGANAGNAYGIALTHTPGLSAQSPVTSDFVVTGNTIEDVPTWHALDTHAGLRIAFTYNTVRRSSRAIFITTDANGIPATDVLVSGNQLDAPAPVTFNLNAITIFEGLRVTVTGNTISGWQPDQTIEDYQGRSVGLVVVDNAINP